MRTAAVSSENKKLCRLRHITSASGTINILPRKQPRCCTANATSTIDADDVSAIHVRAPATIFVYLRHRRWVIKRQGRQTNVCLCVLELLLCVCHYTYTVHYYYSTIREAATLSWTKCVLHYHRHRPKAADGIWNGLHIHTHAANDAKAHKTNIISLIFAHIHRSLF